MEKSRSIHPPKKRITHMGGSTSKNDDFSLSFVDTILQDMDTTRNSGKVNNYLEANNNVSRRQHVKSTINTSNEDSQSCKIAEARFKKLSITKKFPLMEKSQKILKQLKHNRSMPKPRAHLAEKCSMEESVNPVKHTQKKNSAKMKAHLTKNYSMEENSVGPTQKKNSVKMKVNLNENYSKELVNPVKPTQKKNSIKMSEKAPKSNMKLPTKNIPYDESNLDIDLCDDNLTTSNGQSNISKKTWVSNKKLESSVNREDIEEKSHSDQSDTDSEFEKFIAKNKPKTKKMKKRQIEKNQKSTVKNKGKKTWKGIDSFEKTAVNHNLNDLKDNEDADTSNKTAKSKVKVREKYAGDKNVNKKTRGKRKKSNLSKKVSQDGKTQKSKSKFVGTSDDESSAESEVSYSGVYTANSPIYDTNLHSRSSSSENLTEVIESNLCNDSSSDSDSSDSESALNGANFSVKEKTRRILRSSGRATCSKTHAGKLQKESSVTQSRPYSLRSNSFRKITSTNSSTPEHDSASSHSSEHDSASNASLAVPFSGHSSALGSNLTVCSAEQDSAYSSSLIVDSNVENDLHEGLPVETNVEERGIGSLNRTEETASINSLVNSSDGLAVKGPSEDNVPKISFKDTESNFILQSHPKFVSKDFIPYDEFCASGNIIEKQNNADSDDSDIEIVDIIVNHDVPARDSLPCNLPNSQYKVNPDKINCSNMADASMNRNFQNNEPLISVNKQSNISIMIKQEAAEKHDPVYMTNICQDIEPDSINCETSQGELEEDVIVIDPTVLSNVKKEKQHDDEDIIIEFEKKVEPKENFIDLKTNLKRKSDVSFEQIEEAINKFSPSAKIPKIASILNAASLIGSELPLLQCYPVEELPEQSTSFVTPGQLDYRSLLECYKNELKAYKDIKRVETNVEVGLRLVEAHQAAKLNKIRSMIQEVRKRDPNFNKVYETVVDEHSVPIDAILKGNETLIKNFPPRSAVENNPPGPAPIPNLVSDLPMTFIKKEHDRDLSTSQTKENSVPRNVLPHSDFSIGVNPENTGHSERVTTEHSVPYNVLSNPEISTGINPENTDNSESAASPNCGLILPMNFVKIENDEQLANLSSDEHFGNLNSNLAHIQCKTEIIVPSASDFLRTSHVPVKSDLSVLGEKCSFCGKNANAACQRCAKVFFCSNKCGKLFWNQGHKDECGK